MLTVTRARNPFRFANTRQCRQVPHISGAPLSEYLPPDVHDDQESRVALNGSDVPRAVWASIVPPDGSDVCILPRPGVWFTVVVLVVEVLYSAYTIWDGHKRGKLKARHARARAAAAERAAADSMIYGWSGPQNTVEPGVSIPVLYGYHRVGGQVIYAESYRNSNGQNALDTELAVSEGPVQGMVTGTVRIGDRPLSDYTGVTATDRSGTSTQGAGPINPQQVVQTRNTPGNALPVGSPVLYVTRPSRTAYRLTITMPNGLFASRGGSYVSGSAEIARATFQVRERSYPSGAFGGARTFDTGWQRWPKRTFTLTYRSPTMGTDRYEIEVTLNSITAQNVNLSIPTQITATLAMVEEFLEVYPQYPLLAVLTVNAVASAGLSGQLPPVTAEWQGVKIRDWATSQGDVVISSANGVTLLGTNQLTDGTVDYTLRVRVGDTVVISTAPDNGTYLVSVVNAAGNLSVTKTDGSAVSFAGTNPATYTITSLAGAFTVATSYSRNPALIAADVMTNARYGGGQFIADSDIDMAALKDVRDYCNDSVPDGLGGTETRAFCDFYFDGSWSIWDAVIAIARNAQFFVVWSAGKIKFVRDHTGAVVQTFGMGNIKPGSYKHHYMARRQLANKFRVQFLNGALNWQQDVAQIEDPAVLTNSEEVIEHFESLHGITRMSEAMRVAKRNYLMNRNARESIDFEAAADAVASEVGDVIRFIHERQRSELASGRVPSAGTTTTVPLDKSILVPGGGQTVRVVITHVSGDSVATEEQNPVDTAQQGTTVQTLNLQSPQAFATAPAPGDLWAIYQDVAGATNVRLWKIIGIRMTGDLDVKIKAVNYVPSVYTDSDDPGTIPAIE